MNLVQVGCFHFINHTSMNLLIALFLIVFKAVFDGLRDKGKKGIAGLISSIYYAITILIVFAWCMGIQTFLPEYRSDNYIVTIIGFLFIRFGLFDPLYNAIVGKNPVNYIGRTKYWDKLIRRICKWAKFPVEWVIVVRVPFLCIGISYLLDWRFGIIL